MYCLLRTVSALEHTGPENWPPCSLRTGTSVTLLVCLAVCLSACRCVCLSVCPSLCLSVCLSVLVPVSRIHVQVECHYVEPAQSRQVTLRMHVIYWLKELFVYTPPRSKPACHEFGYCYLIRLHGAKDFQVGSAARASCLCATAR